MRGVSSEDKKKVKEFKNQLLSAEELDGLGEVIELLRPATDFTHWVGGSDYSTISQVYDKVHNLLPRVISFQTETAQDMHLKLEALIKSSWPEDKISDGMHLSMHFNPGCAGSKIWDLENAHQIAEHAAEDAAYAATETGCHEN
ncbi:hypothetical protein KI688_006365 [Linnemannia hyalina]|uniref:Uncharacterized protein n=1 Tax=Linnemannia hyalina TaxID=64524 RepID=A0A9P7Y3J5_9FUNG|nr:hypothetical protein KI688_006365 [Linnemannia hyalina]